MVDEEADLRALMMAGLEGDGGAHRLLLAKLAPRLRAFFRARMAAAREEAEDLTQETLIAVHMKRGTYDPAHPFTAWVFAIARYRLIDHWRRTKRRGAHVPLDDAPELAVEADDGASDARRDVTALLERLPPKQRAAISLVKLEGVSVRDAAARTGWSESDIKVSAHRGLKTLARLMGQT